MRKLYLFVNSKRGANWLDCLSMSDDGHILGGHVCSDMQFIMLDLHDRIDRLEKIKSHFKDEPYEVEILSYDDCLDSTKHPGFTEALKLANERDHDYEGASVKMEFTED